jgi:predicted Ser/Thr protein kinase
MSFDPSITEPRRVGQYRLLQRLGEGGMGVVHLALDQNGKAVAIKVLRTHIASDPDARRRLAREVATLRRIRHPRVAAVIDADVECEVPYLVTTFVPGKPLDAHVRDHGPLPRGHVARVGAVLAEALRAIHQSGVVHRDVKPANVMLLDGDPVLIDFGIAHVADESRITHTGLVMGTPGYLSPEIIGGEPVTAATDWWGWGATLAFAATGRPPFGTGPIEVVLDRVRRGQSDIEGVDAGLRATLTAALSVDPVRRPAPERLVAGLAAVAPARAARNGGAGGRPSAPLPAAPNGAGAANGGRTANTCTAGNAGSVVSASRVDGPTERTAPPNEALTSVVPAPDRAAEARTIRVPPPTAAGDAVTEVVPPPFAWASPAPPDTRRFDQPGSPHGRPNGVPGGSATPPPTSSGSPPANGFAGQGGRYASAGQQSQSPPGPSPTVPPGGQPPAGQPPRAPGQPAGRSLPAAVDDATASTLASAGDPTRGVTMGLLVVLAAVAGVAPYDATWIAALAMVVARAIDRSNTALLQRRDQRGPRGSDALVTTLALPWRLLTAGVATVIWLILPILIGISVSFIAASLWAGTAIRPAQPGPLAAGMVALLLTAWFGPGSGRLRRGTHKAVRFAVPGTRSRIVVWSLLALVLISALVVANGTSGPDWGPLETSWLVQQLSAG